MAGRGVGLPGAEKYVTYDGVDAEGRPNGWQGLCTHIRDEVFYRMGFNDREIVALLCGGHVRPLPSGGVGLCGRVGGASNQMVE